MIGTLSQKLKPRLLARFPDRGLRLHEGKEPVASFSAAHPEVGELRIDCGDTSIPFAYEAEARSALDVVRPVPATSVRERGRVDRARAGISRSSLS